MKKNQYVLTYKEITKLPYEQRHAYMKSLTVDDLKLIKKYGGDIRDIWKADNEDYHKRKTVCS